MDSRHVFLIRTLGMLSYLLIVANDHADALNKASEILGSNYHPAMPVADLGLLADLEGHSLDIFSFQLGMTS